MGPDDGGVRSNDLQDADLGREAVGMQQQYRHQGLQSRIDWQDWYLGREAVGLEQQYRSVQSRERGMGREGEQHWSRASQAQRDDCYW